MLLSTLSPRLLLRIFVPFALGYFLSYLFRVVNSIIASNLSDSFDLSASELGLLTSTYLLTFAAIQLPLGILLDRYGPRRTEACLLLFAVLGSAIFASATSFTELMMGRALIGIGVSACLMAAFKAFVQWFPRERLPMINGLHMTAGGLGILFATAPTEMLLQITDWRGLFWILSVFTLGVAAIVFFLVPDKPSTEPNTRLKEHLAGVAHVFSDAHFWRITPWTVTTQASALAVLGLWSGPWFRDVLAYDREQIATALTLIALSLIAGFLLIGFATDRLVKRGYSSLGIAVMGMTIFMMIQLVLIIFPQLMPRLIWVMFGFFSTSSILVYAVLSQHFPSEYAGRANTALNFLVFIAAFGVQWAIGGLIDSFPSNRVGHYAAEGYQLAFISLLGIQLVSAIWYLLNRVR